MVCHSGNGPCYSSTQFKQFALNYELTHTTSSPHFAQAKQSKVCCTYSRGDIKQKIIRSISGSPRLQITATELYLFTSRTTNESIATLPSDTLINIAPMQQTTLQQHITRAG